jgi:hypothetical protein
LEYDVEIKKRTRKVSYWVTQPALALGLSILSFGFYLPFSFIPVDIETVQESSGVFKKNRFIVLVQAHGYKDWEETIECKGQETMVLRPALSETQQAN